MKNAVQKPYYVGPRPHNPTAKPFVKSWNGLMMCSVSKGEVFK
jgi:hypothetical protein